MNPESIFNRSLRKEYFYIPAEMAITGLANTEMPGQVAGVINGNVFAKSKVIILKEGVINGDIRAEELLVYGRINGDVVCSGKITIRSGAFIKGNIATTEIHIEQDTVIEGVITSAARELNGTGDHPGTETTIKNLSVRPFDNVVPLKKDEAKRQAWF